METPPQEWLLNAVTPVKTTVSSNENLDWRFMSKQTVKKDDCIRVNFGNPYSLDAPDTYQSFDMTQPYEEPCKVSRVRQRA